MSSTPEAMTVETPTRTLPPLPWPGYRGTPETPTSRAWNRTWYAGHLVCRSALAAAAVRPFVNGHSEPNPHFAPLRDAWIEIDRAAGLIPKPHQRTPQTLLHACLANHLAWLACWNAQAVLPANDPGQESLAEAKRLLDEAHAELDSVLDGSRP